MMKNHEFWMRRCHELALQGLGHVAPNPMVGCVLVYQDDVVAEGYHMQYGGAHAEVNAIANLTDSALLPEITLYCNLEPCSHFGKTPPCCDLIIEKGIKRVVVGNLDTNPLVAGKGIARMKQAGIEVISGVLAPEGRILNRRFFVYHEQKRPYVILKWAQTANGFVDYLRAYPTNQPPLKISNAKVNALVHSWRAEESAILVGTQTALLDNPQLTNRYTRGKNPLRIVLDRKGLIPPNYHLLDDTTPTLVVTEVDKQSTAQTTYFTLPFDGNLIQALLKHLYHMGIQSLMVEGGPNTHRHFQDAGVVDEIRVIESNQRIDKGVEAMQVSVDWINTTTIEDNRLKIFIQEL